MNGSVDLDQMQHSVSVLHLLLKPTISGTKLRRNKLVLFFLLFPDSSGKAGHFVLSDIAGMSILAIQEKSNSRKRKKKKKKKKKK